VAASGMGTAPPLDFEIFSPLFWVIHQFTNMPFGLCRSSIIAT